MAKVKYKIVERVIGGVTNASSPAVVSANCEICDSQRAPGAPPPMGAQEGQRRLAVAQTDML